MKELIMDDFNIFNGGLSESEDCCPKCGDPYIIIVEQDAEGNDVEKKECSCFDGETL